ncbi:GbsR/MarR family transcriptional regulator [Sulfitobacter delicatus]|mgnify:CR=1 FL=1|jgi:DNA-binding transcriptional regulator GbsR (MarR family)|uniref:DNA-binding transcriptional regulator GbsR, MarR family n=1 Tax=Sulfitobacter delicatus TaxID=218672 RepID=A0A1G7JB21_9RHOB|nr:MarR family transcriptional regulator [Sulfitobacter delicatus]SDF21954.1 DNA-binding transcriptional regulator GbsR, MarR family [Sulfitobacter delicatus]
METTEKLDRLRDDFIARMGVIASNDGMPRMSGQVFAMLVFEGEEVAFGDLAKRLSVSRATISTSIRLLEERGLIRRINKAGDRQDYFQLADDAYAAMTKFALAGTRRSQAEIDDTIEKLPEEAQDVRARLEAFASFYNAISAALEDAIPRVTKPKT